MGYGASIAAGPRVASRLNREDDSTITYFVGFVVFIVVMCSHSLLLWYFATNIPPFTILGQGDLIWSMPASNLFALPLESIFGWSSLEFVGHNTLCVGGHFDLPLSNSLNMTPLLYHGSLGTDVHGLGTHFRNSSD